MIIILIILLITFIILTLIQRCKLSNIKNELMRIEVSIKNSRQTEVLPDEVIDKYGNKYARLYGEYGNTEFSKCD